MKIPQTIPPGSFELITELDKLNPPRCIGPDEQLHDHLRYAGVVELIRLMKAKLEAAERRATQQRSP